MKLALILFILGVLMVVAGISMELSPSCNQEPRVKIVPRLVYDEISQNQDLTDQVYQDMLT
tara:strand:+ start:516 stop:698 length:183 start_codon:yes stop_codon:yes gene_type:complete